MIGDFFERFGNILTDDIAKTILLAVVEDTFFLWFSSI